MPPWGLGEGYHNISSLIEDEDVSETKRHATNPFAFKHNIYFDSLLTWPGICKNINDVNSEKQRIAALKHWRSVRGETFPNGLMKCMSQ